MDELRRVDSVLLPTMTRPILIRPGETDYRLTHESVLETDALIDAFDLHMHYRGRAAQVSLVYPDGREERIFEVPNYDFNWQRKYHLTEPIFAPKGSKLVHSATWDNSAANPLNPDPNQLVKGGFRTTEEMWISAVEYTVPGGRKRPVWFRDGKIVHPTQAELEAAATVHAPFRTQAHPLQ
jgi:hypothetical protein